MNLPGPVVTPELLAKLTEVGWIKDKLLLLVLARADFRCEYCGQDLVASFNDCFNAQKDHLVPRVKGGHDADQNLAASCLTCNALKWDYIPLGDTREAKLADARKYITEKRKEQEAFWNKYRVLMRKVV